MCVFMMNLPVRKKTTVLSCNSSLSILFSYCATAHCPHLITVTDNKSVEKILAAVVANTIYLHIIVPPLSSTPPASLLPLDYTSHHPEKAC